LTEVQKKVELLLKTEEGGFRGQPFAFEEEEKE
jgi:hypothetical protein